MYSAENRKPPAKPEQFNNLWSRKDFLSLSGWVLVISVIMASVVAFMRFMFPRVIFKSKDSFKAGLPDEYPVGAVSEKFIKSQRVWIVRTEDGFYALFAKCTHLGCIPRWLESEDKFKCPCHGSGFHRNGVNFEGPAPRALERMKVTLTEEGDLLIDKNIKFLFEKGEWEKNDAFLKV